MDHPNVNSMFPPDTIARAKLYLSNIKGGVYKTIEAFMEPDGVPLLENEQTILKNCEHLKR